MARRPCGEPVADRHRNRGDDHVRQVVELDTLAIQLGKRTSLHGLRRQAGVMHQRDRVLGRVAALQRQLQVACHLTVEDAGHDRRPARIQLDQQVDAAATQRGGLDHLRAVGSATPAAASAPMPSGTPGTTSISAPPSRRRCRIASPNMPSPGTAGTTARPASQQSRDNRNLNLGERIGLVIQLVEAVELSPSSAGCMRVRAKTARRARGGAPSRLGQPLGGPWPEPDDRQLHQITVSGLNADLAARARDSSAASRTWTMWRPHAARPAVPLRRESRTRGCRAPRRMDRATQRRSARMRQPSPRPVDSSTSRSAACHPYTSLPPGTARRRRSNSRHAPARSAARCAA